MRKDPPSKESAEDDENLEEGRTLTETEAEMLERTVDADPWNIAARLNLIGFYRRNPAFEKSRLVHLRWMIDHCPERYAWRSKSFMTFGKQPGLAEFESAKESWLKQIRSNPSNPDILGNAGLFLIENELDLGKTLLAKACDLVPDEYHWSWELSNLCFYQAQSDQQNDRIRWTEDALRFGEVFLKKYGAEGGRRTSAIRERALIKCARSALVLGQSELAERYANDAIQLVQAWFTKPKRGLSVLGLIALQTGRVEAAQQYLLNWNDIYEPDSIDLELANELIKYGDLSTVVSYLRSCQSLGLWQNRNLDQWIDNLNHNESLALS